MKTEGAQEIRKGTYIFKSLLNVLVLVQIKGFVKI